MNINGYVKEAQYDLYQVRNDDTDRLQRNNDRVNSERRWRDDEEDSYQKKLEEKKAEKEKKTAELNKKLKDTYDKLSDKAKDYLDKLKDKYGNIDFFVADDVGKKDSMNILSGGSKEYSVLMDSKTIESMASSDDAAKHYENLISNALEQFDGMKKEFLEEGLNIKKLGVSIEDDGNTEYYGIVDDSLSYYEKELEKQEKKKAEKLEAKHKEDKEEEKKEELKKEKQEKLEEQSEKRKEFVERQLGSRNALVTAGTIEDLKNQLHIEQERVVHVRENAVPIGVGMI